MKKKLLVLILALALLASLCPTVLAASTLKASEATTEVERKLAELQTQSGYRPGDKGGQCFGFARNVFKKVFGAEAKPLYYHGDNVKSDGMTRVGRCFVSHELCPESVQSDDCTTITAATVKDLLSKAKCGDLIQITRWEYKNGKVVTYPESKYGCTCPVARPHTMIVQQVKSDSIVVYESNFDGAEHVNIREVTFKNFASKYNHTIALFHAKNYDTVNGSTNDTPTSTYVPSTLTIAPTTFPYQNMPQGKPFYFKGTISSNYKISTVMISIRTGDEKRIVQTCTIEPSKTIVDIATSGLDSLKFSELEPGNYVLHLLAIDNNDHGAVKEWKQAFSIAGAAPVTPAPAVSTLTISPTTQPSERMAYHTPFSFEGTITSNYDIAYVYAAVKDRDNGMAYLTRDDSPLVKKYDIKTSILNDLRLDQFATGRYTLVVTAKDTSGKETSWQKDFSIEKPTASQPQEPEDTGYILTINYYVDDKLVQTDHCPGGNSVSAYIYEMPEKYHSQTFRYSTTNFNIGVFQTELWVPVLSQNDTIDLYVTSDSPTPAPSPNVTLPPTPTPKSTPTPTPTPASAPEPAAHTITVVYRNEAGETLDTERVQVNAGEELIHSIEAKKAHYDVVTSYSRDCDCGVHKTLYQLKLSNVDHDGTVYVILRSAQREEKLTGSLENFRHVKSYYSGQFYDVATSDWFDENVARAYELGLMKGVSEDAFDPQASITLAEAITLAARIHSIYHTGAENFVQSGENWYDVYMSYAIANDIPTAPNIYLQPTDVISRKGFVTVLAQALPAQALPVIIEDVHFDDITADTSKIYLLARAGIVRGVYDTHGNLDFKPAATISRAEVAAIVTRMADPALRR